jgi:hypothetical protein
VLIMDVDRQWYGLYWTSDETLLDAMLRPVPPSTASSLAKPVAWSAS